MAQKGHSDFLEASLLDSTFFLELLKHSEQAWPKAELLSASVQVSLRPSFQNVLPISHDSCMPTLNPC